METTLPTSDTAGDLLHRASAMASRYEARITIQKEIINRLQGGESASVINLDLVAALADARELVHELKGLDHGSSDV